MAMNVKTAFTRKEACELTRLSGTQVDYLCKLELIVPEKIGSSKRPTVLYTWDQLIELKVVAKLKERDIPSKYIYYMIEMLRDAREKNLTSVLDSYVLSVPLTEYNKEPKKYDFTQVIEVKGIKLKANNSGITSDNDLKLLLATREQLATWTKDLINLINQFNYAKIEVISPLGDIVGELEDAAKKYNIDNWQTRIQQVA